MTTQREFHLQLEQSAPEISEDSINSIITEEFPGKKNLYNFTLTITVGIYHYLTRTIIETGYIQSLKTIIMQCMLKDFILYPIIKMNINLRCFYPSRE